MDEEDEPAGAGDGDEEPGMEGEAEECGGLRHARAVADERGFDGPLEGAYGSGGAGDEVREVGDGDGLPGADAVGDEADELCGGDEDHAFAGPDDGGLDEK
jgi:hypothetical protein